MTTVFLSGNYWFGSIGGIEENPLELSIWLETIWAGWTEGLKLVPFLYFSAMLLRREIFEAFSVS